MNEYRSAIRVLRDVVIRGQNLDQSFQEQDSPLARQICFGVLRHFYELQNIIAALLKKPLGRKDQDLHLLLLAALYSVQHLKRPVHASLNAAVNSVDVRKPWGKKLINGVIRNFLRAGDGLQVPITREASTNHPAWLIALIEAAYPEQAESIFMANNQHPPMVLRVNPRRCSPGKYLNLLLAAGIQARPGSLSDLAIYLESPMPVEQIPGFPNGDVSVQDEASQLVTEVMNLQSGHRVLDACAAPGGKTLAMLESTDDISLIALDRDPDRTRRIAENLQRAGLTCELLVEDLLNLKIEHKFDRILLDAPCSATGVIRRHPDIKLLRREEDIAQLTHTQRELLAKAWSMLEDHGQLVYATCSLLPQENEHQIISFLASNPDAKEIDISSTLSRTWGYERQHGRQLLPEPAGTDGFYYCRLQKAAS